MLQKVNALFGLNVPDTFTVDVRDRDATLPESAYPRLDPAYKFGRDMLKKVLLFLVLPRQSNLMLFGDTGAGKSSLILQVAARMGIPVFELACSGKTRGSNFLGAYKLIDGNTVWQDGPLVTAMRCGGICLADEITRLDYGEQMTLAPMLDGGSITVPETGEVVVATPGFRFVGTGNSSGYGDESGAYNGEKVASSAFIDRFIKMKVAYPEKAIELAILEAKAPTLGNTLLARMVDFANDVRKEFVGNGGNLRTVVTTRSLVSWALTTVQYSQFSVCEEPINGALNDVILAAAPSDESASLSELWTKWRTTGAAPDFPSPF